MDRAHIALQRAIDMAELRTGCQGVPLSVLHASFGTNFASKYPHAGTTCLLEYLEARPELFCVERGTVRTARRRECASQAQPAHCVLDSVAADGFKTALTEEVANSLKKLSFHQAVALGDDAVQLVIERAMRHVDERDADQRTPLMLAGTLSIAQLLRRHGADITLEDSQGWTALSHAAHHGRVETIRFLAKQAANVWHKDTSGDTPLHLAAAAGQHAAASVLLSEALGSDPALAHRAVVAENRRGESCLHLAAASGCSTTIAGILGAVGAEDAGSPDSPFTRQCLTGDTPLHLACAVSDTAALLVWERCGSAAAATLNNRGESPLQIAARKRMARAVDALAPCSDLGSADTGGRTAVHDAAERGFDTILTALMTAAAGGAGGAAAVLRLQDCKGFTPLHYACQEGRVACTSILMAHGSDPHIPTSGSYYLPVHVAAAHGHSAVLSALLEVDPSMVGLQVERSLVTPLHAACISNSLDGIRTLLQHGASCDDLTYEGDSAIHLVAVNPTLETIRAVIATDNLTSATLRAANRAGRTLHTILCAALNGAAGGSSLVDCGEIQQCVSMINIRTQELLIGEEGVARVAFEAGGVEATKELAEVMQAQFDATALEEELNGYMDLRYFTYSQLKLPESRLSDEDINIYLREFYLADGEFQSLFGTDKEQYRLWPQHKKEVKKKELDLLDEAM